MAAGRPSSTPSGSKTLQAAHDQPHWLRCIGRSQTGQRRICFGLSCRFGFGFGFSLHRPLRPVARLGALISAKRPWVFFHRPWVGAFAPCASKSHVFFLSFLRAAVEYPSRMVSNGGRGADLPHMPSAHCADTGV